MSAEVRRLTNKWQIGTSWPQRLEWIEVEGIRGWTGQRFELRYPIMAVVGENGAGKSTLLQCAASVYRQPLGTSGKASFASDFFPDTPWEKVQQAAIRFAFRQGKNTSTGSIRKPTNRWRGNPERPSRDVLYIDLTRIQPAARELLHELPVGAHDTPVQLPAIGFRLNGDALAPTRPPRLVGQDNDRWLSRR